MISLWQQQALTEYQINMSVIDRSSLRHMWRENNCDFIKLYYISSSTNFIKNVLFIIIIWLAQLEDVYRKLATLTKSQASCIEHEIWEKCLLEEKIVGELY